MIADRRLVALLVVVGCAGGGDDGAARVSIDTLPNGAVVVHNEGRGAWDSASAWRLEEDLRIGSAESEGPDGLNRIVDLAVDPLGRIFVLEGDAQEIRVFDAAATFVRTVGRKGGGPGEFQQAIGMRWDSDGHLWIVDQGTARYTVLDTAGRVLAMRPRSISGWFTWRWLGGLDSSGAVYEWYRMPGGAAENGALLRYDATLKVADTFALPQYQGDAFKIEEQSRRVTATVPYAPTLAWTFDPRGYLWFGITAPYRIYQRRLRGDTLRIIERQYVPLAVTGEEKDSAVARLKWFTDQGGRVDRSRLPDVKPAFGSLSIDDGGHLWVTPTVAPPDAGRVFDVFAPDGRYLGRARSAVKLRSLYVFRGDHLYGETVDDNDVPFVVRMRIVRTRSTPAPSETPPRRSAGPA